MNNHKAVIRVRKLLQKTMAVLLAAVLVAGMAHGAVSEDAFAQEADIASGTGWVLDADGKLTISSDAGMADWASDLNRTCKEQIKIVEIQNGVTSIGYATFNYCYSLASITIPESVTSIGQNAFGYCRKLTSITIPKNVKEIGTEAFGNCSSLAYVIMESETPPEVKSFVFDDCGFVTDEDDTTGIYVPTGKAQAYKDAWTDWADYIADGPVPAEEHKHDNVTFTPWTETDSLPTDAGNYYLTENVTLSEKWEVPSGKTTLCLNGKTITGSRYRVITIAVSSTLNLYDCQNTGKITNGRGGVSNEGTFRMYGGKISGNRVQTMSGGGVDTNGGNFYMYGGEISGNYGYTSGGVSVGNGTFRMYGGKISENSAAAGYAGVFNYGGTFIVGGDAVISGNTYNGKENNVSLQAEQTIELDSSKPLSGSAKIGITTETAPAGGSPVNITGTNGADYSSYFTSDSKDYEIVNGENNVVQLAVKAQTYAVTVHNGTGGGNYRAGATVTITANAPASGKQFDGWQVSRGGVTLADSTSSTTTFTMPDQQVDVSATYKDITEEHTHNYGDWQHDDTQHWKVCACGDETDRANHDFGDWITDKAATATETGTKHRECQTCGYRQTETIPVTGTDPGSGTVTPEVKPGVNAPATNISTSTEELKDMLLTEEEKQQVQSGTNMRIVLEVQDAGNTVSGLDQAAVAQALNGFTVGQYLNIDLYKLIGENRADITETAKKIRIVITVPEALRNTDGSKTRAFAVIRVHDGRGELLTDLDSSADTITIETDRFSTYAVVYQDKSNGGTKPDSPKDNEPKTGDDAPLELYATLAMIAGFSYLLLYFTDRKRGITEETKRELVARLIAWAKRGGKLRKLPAFAAIFAVLVYYHSIGKNSICNGKEFSETEG